MDKFNIFDIDICNLSNKEIISYIDKSIASNKKKSICYANIHTLNLVYSNNEFRKALNSANLIINDGIGVRLAASFRGKKIKRENINNLWPDAFESWKNKENKFFIFGGLGNVAERAAEKLSQGGQKIVGYHTGENLNNDLVEKINNSKAEILIVGLGHPLQEFWIHENISNLNTPVTIAVGALISFLAGETTSHSPLLRRYHMEWLWRLAKDPRKLWKRYLIGIPLFYFRLLLSLSINNRKIAISASKIENKED